MSGARNEADRCVADLVEATKFGAGSDVRRTLTVIYESASTCLARDAASS
jgi:hypothetical protein